MKVYQFILMAIKISLYKVVEAKNDLPCSTASGLPVIEICSTGSVIQDAHTYKILLKVSSEQECQCQLTIDNHNTQNYIEVQFNRFGDLTSSSPSGFESGVIVQFGITGDIFFKAEGVFSNFKYNVSANNSVDISTVHVNGTLKTNEGYCFEIIKTDKTLINNGLVLQCNKKIVQTSTTMTPSISDSTTSRSLISGPMMQHNKTDVEVPKTNYVSNVTSTSDSDSDTALYISVGAAVIGTLGLALVVLVVARRLYYIKKTKQDASRSDVNVNRDVVYDGLQYNVLYVPSTNNLQLEQHDTTDQRQQISVDTTDGTYSTADIAVPSGSIISDKNSYIDEGSPTKQNTIQTQRNNVIYYTPNKKKVKHIFVPGNEACEYAVVDKKLEK